MKDLNLEKNNVLNNKFLSRTEKVRESREGSNKNNSPLPSWALWT
jgi:hypothetical protein